jgi:hypothetical protein
VYRQFNCKQIKSYIKPLNKIVNISILITMVIEETMIITIVILLLININFEVTHISDMWMNFWGDLRYNLLDLCGQKKNIQRIKTHSL